MVPTEQSEADKYAGMPESAMTFIDVWGTTPLDAPHCESMIPFSDAFNPPNKTKLQTTDSFGSFSHTSSTKEVAHTENFLAYSHSEPQPRFKTI